MFSNSSKFCVVTLMLLAMISCGGKVESELTAAENQIQVQKIQNLQVVGLWRSPESATGFEFFSSVINGPEASGLKTGRVLDGNSVKHQFWWTASADGKIQLNLVSPNCNARPLSYCEASEQVTITARGDNAKSSIWTIEYDQDYDNISDRTDVYPYTKELIGIEDFSHNELYLQESEYFAFATRLDVSGTQVSVHLIHLDETLVAHGELMAAGADLVQLATTEDASVIESQSFYVEGVGYRDLEVQKTYQNVVLRKSSGNGFSVAYDIETEVLIPAELDGLRIDTGSTQERVSFTRVGNTVGDFLTESRVSNGMIAAGKQFVTFIPYLFNDEIVLLGAGNRLSFNTDEAGSLSRDDINAGENARAVNFTWQENDGGELLLTLDGGDTVGIRFVKPITGGYQVLYSIDSEEHGEAYVIHDLFESKLRMDMSDQIPGKFRFSSSTPNGFGETELSFNEDGSVTFTDLADLSGYWFFDEFNNVVSFECVDLLGQQIDIYQECFDYFQSIEENPMVDFAHIRRIGFMYEGDGMLRAQYDANFWGGMFGKPDGGYQGVSMTYRVRRVGASDK